MRKKRTAGVGAPAAVLDAPGNGAPYGILIVPRSRSGCQPHLEQIARQACEKAARAEYLSQFYEAAGEVELEAFFAGMAGRHRQIERALTPRQRGGKR